MTSAYASFESNLGTVELLRDIRDNDASYTQDQRAALNKSGMAFIVTAWEAFVEDLAREGAGHLATHVPKFDDLPLSVRQAVIGKVTDDKHHLAVGRLADAGWGNELRDLAKTLTTGSAFNTPNAVAVGKLFEKVLGIGDITAGWKWQKNSADKSRTTLTTIIRLRGDIIHQGVKPANLNKQWLKTYGEFVKRLAANTETQAIKQCNKLTTVPMS